MSHSLKKHNITGFTTAASEKQDKQAAARKKRRACRQHLDSLADADSENCLDEGNSDPWLFAKDGKQHNTDPKWRRK